MLKVCPEGGFYARKGNQQHLLAERAGSATQFEALGSRDYAMWLLVGQGAASPDQQSTFH